MDFKDIKNKKALQDVIPTLMESYKKNLLDLSESGNPSDYKKAALLFYWLRDYQNMIQY